MNKKQRIENALDKLGVLLDTIDSDNENLNRLGRGDEAYDKLEVAQRMTIGEIVDWARGFFDMMRRGERGTFE